LRESKGFEKRFVVVFERSEENYPNARLNM